MLVQVQSLTNLCCRVIPISVNVDSTAIQSWPQSMHLGCNRLQHWTAVQSSPKRRASSGHCGQHDRRAIFPLQRCGRHNTTLHGMVMHRICPVARPRGEALNMRFPHGTENLRTGLWQYNCWWLAVVDNLHYIRVSHDVGSTWRLNRHADVDGPNRCDPGQLRALRCAMATSAAGSRPAHSATVEMVRGQHGKHSSAPDLFSATTQLPPRKSEAAGSLALSKTLDQASVTVRQSTTDNGLLLPVGHCYGQPGRCQTDRCQGSQRSLHAVVFTRS
mmetsp:Transcript_21302/g.51581  ORF Transcript_21302/g.51581 Transcript_21302/m.51581 type:complete len:274 (-) Transcript_21302:422-1243(-)